MKLPLPIWALPLILTGSLGLTYILPQEGETQASAVAMELPRKIGGWIMQGKPPSKDEIDALGKGTEFSKATCLLPRPGEYTPITQESIPYRIDLSIVLSGRDMNTSIHRPERCMPAQGHLIKNSMVVPVVLPNGREVTMRRLKSTQMIKDPSTGAVVSQLDSLTYYFFVGHDQVTHDHLERTIYDMEKRLLEGADQRWAYVSVTMWYGNLSWFEKPVTEEEADEVLLQFLTDFSLEQIDWSQIK